MPIFRRANGGDDCSLRPDGDADPIPDAANRGARYV